MTTTTIHDPLFISRRSCILSPPSAGCVSCTQPLVSEIGRYILSLGGNAVDASIAMAAGMQLMEPCSTGLGGDCYALYHNNTTKTVSALNGSGHSPALLTYDKVIEDLTNTITSTVNNNSSTDTNTKSFTTLPSHHPHTITIPGAARGWEDALIKWGTMSMKQVLAPVIKLAKEGFPVSPLTSYYWNEGVNNLLQWRTLYPNVQDQPEDLLMINIKDSETKFSTVSSTTAASIPLTSNNYRGPHAGEIFRNLALAHTLEILAEEGADGFYSGSIGQAIVNAVQSVGGVMTLSDLQNHKSTFPDPISVDFCGMRVWEVPPNGQGITALMALNTIQHVLQTYPKTWTEYKEKFNSLPSNINENTDPLQYLNTLYQYITSTSSSSSSSSPPFPTSFNYSGAFSLLTTLPNLTKNDKENLQRLASLGHNSPAYLHLLIEALRGAFADAREYVTDMDNSKLTKELVNKLLSSEHGIERAQQFSAVKVSSELQNPMKGTPLASSDTVSFQVVDKYGNAVSFINSNYMGFGSGLVPRQCGFSLQNRGAGFSLIKDHFNCIGPNKRPYHTIIPTMATTRTNEFLATYSNMGGFMQPQGHVQLSLNLLSFITDPQLSLDLPRFCISDGTSNGKVSFEDGIHPSIISLLETMEIPKSSDESKNEEGQTTSTLEGKKEGHLVVKTPIQGYQRALFGRGQIILQHPITKVLWAGSDGRGDGCSMSSYF